MNQHRATNDLCDHSVYSGFLERRKGGSQKVDAVFIGFMGSGKTSVGERVAAKLGVAFTDSDHVISAETGRTPQVIVRDCGEKCFREIEKATIARILLPEKGILSLGGGSVEDIDTRLLLSEEIVVYLDVSFETAMRRVGHDESRPTIRRPDVREIYEQRRASYASVANLIIGTDEGSVDDIAEAIVLTLRAPE